jgi:rhodanese-related sulfurtransferase
MQTYAIVFAAFMLAIVGGLVAPAVAAEAPRMEMDELKAQLGNPEMVIIDVRSYTDWLLSSDKVKGAVRENYRDFEGWNTKYPKDKAIVLYCA